ncbi:hypothetical protein AWN76_015890 [Rhodothermaceae bacterium RA]|nr:hypothetical protein AWN76_015890 [Rhodothermaceae bacterium RA]
MTSRLRLLLGGLVLLFVALQFVPVDRSNPPVSREVRWDRPETRALAQRACFDCHSNETVWPWYAYVAPVSWRVAGHVEDGRRHLNFSAWDQPNEDADEVEEVLREGEMPLWDYVLLHPEARLTGAETEALIEGLRATFAADPPVPRRRSASPEPGS